MDKLYKLGLLVGRFQCLHKGHEDMIRTAAALSERTAVFIGSSQEKRTANNPFAWEERRDYLRAVFPEKNIEIYPLPDIFVGNTGKWGEYVLHKAAECCGLFPDLLVSGKETRRAGWFEGETGENVTELYIPKTIDISGSEMRAFLISGDEASFRKFTSEALWDKYDLMREIILSCRENTETGSV